MGKSAFMLEYDYGRKEYAMSSARLGNDGSRIRETMAFPVNLGGVTEKRLEAHRLRTHRMLGKVHDPIKDTMAHLDATHVFGRYLPFDEYGVAQLVRSTVEQDESIMDLTVKMYGVFL
jgi:hypothetical protein